MKQYYYAACAALTVACVGGGAFAQDIPVIAEVKETGVLTIANSLAYAPFEFIDENNKPAGLGIELANAFAALLPAELKIEVVPFANQIPGLAAGRVKVGWATFSVTSERLAQVDFVSFMQAGTVIVTSPDKRVRFADKAALCGTTIAIQTGTAADFAADRLSKECEANGQTAINKAIYPEQKDVIQAVLTGRAEAYLDDSTSAGYYQTTTDGKLVVASESFYPMPLGLAVAKGDSATAAMLKAGFEKLISNGTYRSILEKYNMLTSAATKIVVYTDKSQIE